MGIRITSWNVNGIRNPFGYQPWSSKRSYEAMFDILEADIVVLQEAKIQRKDLSDDMVLVPGWDCFFSLPNQKKGYSGVVIYTRQSACIPVKAEEGLTGALNGPSSAMPYAELPHHQQIGGYPTQAQLSELAIDPLILDSEGRCVILEFPAFVLIGVYCPANRDESRDAFRLSFLTALDFRVRNLRAQGKQVVLTGDLNVSREEIDAANAEANMRKQGLVDCEFVSTPARRLFNQLLIGGKVLGDRDIGREEPMMIDLCRTFHPGRKGMFTCWEQKLNARPANCGARIDYILCSEALVAWFRDADIQEGLMGSDHCPVYATLKESVDVDGQQKLLKQVMNPEGAHFDHSRSSRGWQDLYPLPLSGRQLSEFQGRRSIRDMFVRHNSRPKISNSISESGSDFTRAGEARLVPAYDVAKDNESGNLKRSPSALDQVSPSPSQKVKRSKPMPSTTARRSATIEKKTRIGQAVSRNQRTLQDFLRPDNRITSASLAQVNPGITDACGESTSKAETRYETGTTDQMLSRRNDLKSSACRMHEDCQAGPLDEDTGQSSPETHENATLDHIDHGSPINRALSQQLSWSELFTQPVAPRCESHDEPCVTLLTKKAGMNLGRSFWMCSRPLGPSGTKEKNTQWRCQTFIWCSDWKPHSNISKSVSRTDTHT